MRGCDFQSHQGGGPASLCMKRPPGRKVIDGTAQVGILALPLARGVTSGSGPAFATGPDPSVRGTAMSDPSASSSQNSAGPSWAFCQRRCSAVLGDIGPGGPRDWTSGGLHPSFLVDLDQQGSPRHTLTIVKGSSA